MLCLKFSGDNSSLSSTVMVGKCHQNLVKVSEVKTKERLSQHQIMARLLLTLKHFAESESVVFKE